ncbi:NADH-quinone oxidoreductase subunit C [Rhizobium sp. SYY.PMSO]|uniref:NADH-quinone oxidoreductase subunit D-related protein n=1 Tax=Rhizobium sp. SYY.PMSO TaxID=3382192 RepID=UPI0039901435
MRKRDEAMDISGHAVREKAAVTVQELCIDAAGLVDAADELKSSEGRMQMAYARRVRQGQIELRYLVGDGKGKPFTIWKCPVEDKPIPSLSRMFPMMSWYENEISDLFGIEFADHPDRRSLLFENVPSIVAPFNPDAVPKGGDASRQEGHKLPLLEGAGSDVQRLPFGPVRADVVESAEFLFFYVGEQILHYHPQLFFKHRGMEKRFEGLTIQAGAVMAERVSGVGTIAHALAYCQAVEAAAGCEVPMRGRCLRVLLAEMERVYNHLHYLGNLADATTLKVGQAEGRLLEEQTKQLNAQLTGSRFLRSVLVPGGLRRDLYPEGWLASKLEGLRKAAARYIELLESTDSFLDRLFTNGVLQRKVAFDQGATGPVERASGLDRDLRRDHCYAAYDTVPLTVPIQTAGDAHARFKVRVAELDASIVMIQRILLLLKEGPVHSNCVPAADTFGLGWAESPRGTLFYAVHIDEHGRLGRVKIKSPSFSNWRVFPFTVHDSNMMDYAINEASFGLTIAGCDR